MTAKKILALAAAEIGTKESPPDSNNVKYNTAYYGREVHGSAYPWCCVFQWWVFQQAGASELFYGGHKTASCTTLYNWYKKKGQAVPVQEARPGDLVFFNFDGDPSVMNHIGICEYCEGGYITTIDGNTGTNNEANGGAVMRRKRALKYVGGVARPNYEEDDMTREEIKSMIDEAVDKALAERDAVAAQVAQKVSAWAKEPWDKLTLAGIFDGTRPGGPLTREQAAVVIDRLGLTE